MSRRSVAERVERLGSGLERLREALAEPSPNDLMIDGTIQRFEFVFELFWKAFKAAVEHEGLRANTPRVAIRQAFVAELIEDEAAWLSLLEARNLTTHLYDEATARRVFDELRERQHVLDDAFQSLLERFPPDV